MYTVHEAAKLAHTTVMTLHHYHKIGLLIHDRSRPSFIQLKELRTIIANPFLQRTRFFSERDSTIIGW